MKAKHAMRAARLVAASKEWHRLETACRKRSDQRGCEFLVGELHIDDDSVYVDNHDASVTIDCQTAAIVCRAAREIIVKELSKLGVTA